jgi:hypothetical protein
MFIWITQNLFSWNLLIESGVITRETILMSFVTVASIEIASRVLRLYVRQMKMLPR